MQGVTQRGRLVGRELHDEPTATFEWYAHDQAASLLGDLERTVARSRLHGRHICLLVSGLAAGFQFLATVRLRQHIT